MKTKNISKFVLKFIKENKNSNQLVDDWNSEKNLNALDSFFKKKDKDLTKPKRGKSSYLHFCDDYRASAKKKLPNSSNKEILNYLGDLWKKIKLENPDIAEKYENIAKKERDIYKSQMTLYKSENKYEKKEEVVDDDKISSNEELEDKDIELLLSIKEQMEQMEQMENNNIKEEDVDERTQIKKDKKDKKEVVEVNDKKNSEMDEEDNKGFQRYVKKRKNKFMEEYPELDSDQLFAKMKKKWTSLSEEKKQKYIK